MIKYDNIKNSHWNCKSIYLSFFIIVFICLFAIFLFIHFLKAGDSITLAGYSLSQNAANSVGLNQTFFDSVSSEQSYNQICQNRLTDFQTNISNLRFNEAMVLGKVLKADGSPCSNAKIIVNNPSSRQKILFASEDGTFYSIQTLVARPHFVSIIAFLPENSMIYKSVKISLFPNDVKRLNLVLPDFFLIGDDSLYGTIYDKHYVPVENARIELHQNHRLFQSYLTMSDGFYIFPGMLLEDYYIYIFLPNENSVTLSRNVVFNNLPVKFDIFLSVAELQIQINNPCFNHDKCEFSYELISISPNCNEIYSLRKSGVFSESTFSLRNVPFGEYDLVIGCEGFAKMSTTFIINDKQNINRIDFLLEKAYKLNIHFINDDNRAPFSDVIKFLLIEKSHRFAPIKFNSNTAGYTIVSNVPIGTHVLKIQSDYYKLISVFPGADNTLVIDGPDIEAKVYIKRLSPEEAAEGFLEDFFGKGGPK